MKVIPVGRKILVKPAEADKYYNGTNILIPESQQKAEPKGTVVGVGDSVAQIKQGDFIQYSVNASIVKMQHEGDEHYLINEGDIFAVLVGE
jgi:co-chaperonin GroES (HSP10)